MSDADPRAARTALQALGLSAGARLLPSDDLILTLLPREDGLTPKDIPVDQLLHKITMMRDKLRVLEQRVNAAEGISTTQRGGLQSHITAVSASCAGLVSFFSAEALPVVENHLSVTTTTPPTTTPTTTTTTTPTPTTTTTTTTTTMGPLGKTITRKPS